MKPLILFCKSYRADLNRAMRLVKSIQRFNTERLPVHFSVPQLDLSLFQHCLEGYDIEFHTDDEILKTSSNTVMDLLARQPGRVTQQVIKSEFWRLGLSTSYLCLDSDAFFIRPFGVADFLAQDGTPYTVIDEGREIFEGAIRRNKERVLSSFREDAQKVQNLFERQGRQYNFGPFPVVWHRAVWQSLHEEYLKPRGMSFADAITFAPSEARWYGEALLKYKAIPVNPCQAFFKVYHYAWQLDLDHRMGMSNEQLAQIYSGVIYQSSWEREMDWPSEGGNKLSWLARRLRRKLGRV
jgi:hypothetical protein